MNPSNFSGSSEVYGDRRVGQTYHNENSITLDSCSFYLRDYTNSVSDIRVKVYAHTGTFGTDGKPTGSVLATSDDVSISQLSTSFGWIDFEFSGSDRINLSQDTSYCFILECPGATNSQDGVSIGEDRTDTEYPGNLTYSFNAGSSWSSSDTRDEFLKVYGSVGTIAWSNPSYARSSDDNYASFGSFDYYTVVDNAIKIVKSDGSIGSTNKADTETRWGIGVDTTIYYGDSTDLWGETWSASDINDSDFGVVISGLLQDVGDSIDSEYLKATNFGFNIPTGSTIEGIEIKAEKQENTDSYGGEGVSGYVDHIQIKVYYTESTGTPTVGVKYPLPAFKRP
jgi:hypothetical protein